ncbi:MMPL family transporter (plasmid) [Rubrobacter tropicus]|uniref:MMPL family transporter n=1 Tax=Rubrobacter tropicus TaxID=2653851 RepID=A0A6G8QG47_9ACTN|nr:MMPL family transporter [Rubrobacter tropicus]QIN85428.1 MMPL family transporter [Rubrobacter tropicus]
MFGKRGLFGALGRISAGHPWLVLAFWALAALAAAPAAEGVGGRLSAAVEVPAGSEPAAVSGILEGEFPGRDPEQLVLAVRSGDGGPRAGEPAYERAVDRAVGAVADVPGVGSVTTHRDGAERLAGLNGRAEAVLVGIEGADAARAQEVVGEVREALEGVEKPPSMDFLVTGDAAVYLDATELSDRDVARAETTALPITLTVLVVAFGALVAAFLPLVVAVVAIVLALGALFLATDHLTVSIFAQSVVTILGLAVGIDYALLMVNRFREELGRGLPSREAAEKTAATAGRTVAFSGGTVAVSMAALLVPPVEAVRSIGVAGLLVVLAAVAASVTAVPAMLALLGGRVNAPRFLHRLTARTRGEGFWRALAGAVLSRPVPYALAVTALLAALALPLLGARIYNPAERQIGTAAESRQGLEVLNGLGLGGTMDALDVVVDLGEGESFYGSDAVADVDRLARDLEGLDGVDLVVGPTTTTGKQDDVPAEFLKRFYASERAAAASPVADLAKTTLGAGGRYVLLQVLPEGRLGPEEAGPFVGRVEEAAQAGAPGGGAVMVGGFPAENLEYAAAVNGSLPLAVAAVFGATFVLLLLAFRSLAVPLLSILMNTLSVGAALGLLVLVFQEGVGGGLFGLPEGGLGSLEEILPVTVFAVTFGLSMDYQVFLLSRVQEEHLAGRGVAESVSRALSSTGRVISFAALIMLVVFAAFLTSELAAVQALGFGLAAAVLLDATLVRLVLVPALLRLAGDRLWWLPGRPGGPLPAVEGRGPESSPGPEEAGSNRGTRAPGRPGRPRSRERL